MDFYIYILFLLILLVNEGKFGIAYEDLSMKTGGAGIKPLTIQSYIFWNKNEK